MARLRQNFQRGVVTNNPLAIGGLTLNSAALAGFQTVTGPDYAEITLDPLGRNGAPEIVLVSAHTASATSATIARAQEDTAARAHPAGTVWEHTGTGFDHRVGATARAMRASTSLTLNSVTWANVDTALDLVLGGGWNGVLAGDWVEVGVSALWGNEAVDGFLDAVSIVAGSPVRSWGNDAAPDDTWGGVRAWEGIASRLDPCGGSVVKQIVAGELSGSLTIRLRYRTATATNKGLGAVVEAPLVFWAHNLLQY